MANLKQSKKRARQNDKRRMVNMAWRSKMKTYMKKTDAAMEKNEPEQVNASLGFLCGCCPSPLRLHLPARRCVLGGRVIVHGCHGPACDAKGGCPEALAGLRVWGVVSAKRRSFVLLSPGVAGGRCHRRPRREALVRSPTHRDARREWRGVGWGGVGIVTAQRVGVGFGTARPSGKHRHVRRRVTGTVSESGGGSPPNLSWLSG
jgi:hypothetical protein